MKRKHRIVIEVESDYGAAWASGDEGIDNSLKLYCAKIKQELSDPRSKTYMHFMATASISCVNVYLDSKS